MGTTAQKLANIANVKSALADIITAKGEAVPTRLADYPSKLQPVDYLQGFTSEGFTGDVRSNITNLDAYGLYNFKCSGSLYLPRLTSTSGRNAMSYVTAREVHVENLTTLGDQQTFTHLVADTLFANRVSVASGVSHFQYLTVSTAYVGWQGVNGSVDEMRLVPTFPAQAALFRYSSHLETLYLGRILSAYAVGSNNKFSGCTSLRTIYCGSNSPDTLQPLISTGWTIPTPANCTIYCWVQEELKWYQFTWDGSTYTYTEMSDTSGMPPIPTGA